MKRLLLATHNPAKLEELKIGLKKLEKHNITLLSLNDVRVEKEPVETGSTFQENSELKARFYSNLTDLPTIADDGGLIIPYLNNAPGVKSKRWPGYESSDQELIDYTLLHLRGVKQSNRTAYLETCITFYSPKLHSGGETVFFEQEKIKGYIAEKPSNKATNGYPFRALFIVDEFNKYYDELTEKEHNKINHRYVALKKLTKRIIDLLR